MRYGFYLASEKVDRTSLVLNIAIAGKRYKIGVGTSIRPSDWNKRKQRPRASDPYINQHVERIEYVEAIIKEAYKPLMAKGRDKDLPGEVIEDFIHTLRREIKPERSPEDATYGDDFKGRFTEFVDTYTIRTRGGQITSRRPKPATINTYKHTLTVLEEWAKAHHRRLTFTAIDDDFYRSFTTWLPKHRNITDAAVGNYIKVLKQFMRWAEDKDYHTTKAYRRFHRDKSTRETITLTLTELRALRDLDLSGQARLARTRDIYLLQAYTGQRYEDLIRLEPQHFDEKAGIIRIVTNKTGAIVRIPIHGPLATLLTRYPKRLFEFPSDQKQNDYLKEVAQLAGLDRTFLRTSTKLGERIEERFPIHQKIATHSARRTFASLSSRFGIPEAAISCVTGHSARNTLQEHYISFDDEALVETFIKGWEQF